MYDLVRQQLAKIVQYKSDWDIFIPRLFMGHFFSICIGGVSIPL